MIHFRILTYILYNYIMSGNETMAMVCVNACSDKETLLYVKTLLYMWSCYVF